MQTITVEVLHFGNAYPTLITVPRAEYAERILWIQAEGATTRIITK